MEEIGKIYSHKKKEKLANRISKIKRKKELVKIFEIIRNENDTVTENNNGLFMYFHNLKYDTYIKIEKYLALLDKQILHYSDNTIISEDSQNNNCTNTDTAQKEYKPYTTDDFPSQREFSPKLKYSNKEKNLIKRQRYDDNINSENNINESILYCNFNVSNLTDSDIINSEGNERANSGNNLNKQPIRKNSIRTDIPKKEISKKEIPKKEITKKVVAKKGTVQKGTKKLNIL